MTEFMNKSFSVYSGTGEAYRDAWDRIFKREAEPIPPRLDEVPDTERETPAKCVTPSGRTDCHGFYQSDFGTCDFCGEPVPDIAPDSTQVPEPPR